MRKILIASTLVFATLAGSAYASSNKFNIDAPRDQWMSKDAIAAKYKGEGYEVRKVKEEKGVYEIYAINASGKKMEILVHPVTGEMLGNDKDD